MAVSRIAGRFQHLREQGRKALIPYVVAGDPGLDVTVPLMHRLVEGGVLNSRADLLGVQHHGLYRAGIK